MCGCWVSCVTVRFLVWFILCLFGRLIVCGEGGGECVFELRVSEVFVWVMLLAV